MAAAHSSPRWKPAVLVSLLSIGLGYGLPAYPANLLDMYQLAEQNDQILKAADQKRMATQENIPIQRANLLPQIGATAGVSYNRTDIQSGGFPGAPHTIEGTGRNIGLNLNQVIYNQIDNLTLGVADLQAQQADLDYAAAQQDLILRTSEAYFAVLKANASLQLSIASQDAFKNQLEQAQKRFEVGLVAVTDVANAQANYDKANADIITARNSLENARAALATIIGQEPPELDDVKTNLTTPGPNPRDLGAWTELSSKQNLGLNSAEIGSRISQQNIEINRAARMPTVNLTGQYGYNSTPNQFNGLRNSTVNGTIGLEVSVPLYTGGRINAKSRQAAFQYQQTQNEVENLRRQIQQSTANDYRGVITNISEIRAYEQAVESARTSLAATQAGYQVGTRTIVDVLNAQIQVFSAMANFLNARYGYLTSSLQLKSDTGQLSVTDLKAINDQLVPGKVNALIAPLMGKALENQKEQDRMIQRVLKRAQQTVDGPSAH